MTERTKEYFVDCSDKRGEFILSTLIANGYNAQKYTTKQKVGENKVFIFTPIFPLNTKQIYRLPRGCSIYAYDINEMLQSALKKKSIEVFLYSNDEIYIAENAILTARAVAVILGGKFGSQLSRKKTLITGDGFVAKALVQTFCERRLKKTLAKRSERKIVTWCDDKEKKVKTKRLKGIKNYQKKFDIIINTIPALIFTERVLKKASKTTLYIDLASKPGGFDFVKANEFGLTVLQMLGLPGKYYPFEAAEVILDYITREGQK